MQPQPGLPSNRQGYPLLPSGQSLPTPISDTGPFPGMPPEVPSPDYTGPQPIQGPPMDTPIGTGPYEGTPMSPVQPPIDTPMQAPPIGQPMEPPLPPWQPPMESPMYGRSFRRY